MQIQHFKSTLKYANALAAEKQFQLERQSHDQMEEEIIDEAQQQERIRPLTDQLGSERILRTSTLVPVPEVCCTE